jgi:hypothetical protein
MVTECGFSEPFRPIKLRNFPHPMRSENAIKENIQMARKVDDDWKGFLIQKT